jgi:hypothetical protein
MKPSDLVEVARCSSIRRLPETLPAPQPLPTVRDLLAAFRESGTHGDHWFTVKGRPPNPQGPYDERHVGEISLTLPGFPLDGPSEVEESTELIGAGFRKGSLVAIFDAMRAFSKVAGDICVLDNDGVLIAILSADADREVLGRGFGA